MTTIEKTIQNLHRNHMKGYYVANKNELISVLEQLIVKGASVGCGDSVTLEDTGVFDFLRNGNYVFYDKHDPTITSEEKRKLYIKNFDADYFVSSSNAITEDGKLFNIDGNGSRIAPIIYGPKQVIIVVGKNKIVKNTNVAIERTRQIAAPLDAKRLGKQTPCAKTGKCYDCKHPQRICNHFVLTTGQFNEDRIKVIIIDDILGY